MKDWKTTSIAICTLVVTIATAAKSVLTGGVAALDLGLTVQTISGALVALGLYHAADAK